jgi:hypothetical protein
VADDPTNPTAGHTDGEARNDVEAVRLLLAGGPSVLGGELEDFDDLGAPDVDLLAPPAHWLSVDPAEVPQRLTQLFEWTCELQGRFPEMVRLPSCWPRHNSLVELLQALSDAERACFAPTSPPTAAAVWHRVFADLEHRIRGWIVQLGCGDTARPRCSRDALSRSRRHEPRGAPPRRPCARADPAAVEGRPRRFRPSRGPDSPVRR